MLSISVTMMARLMLNLQERAEGGRDFLTSIGSPSNPQSTTMIFSSEIGVVGDEMTGTGTTMFHTGELDDTMGQLSDGDLVTPISPEEVELGDVIEVTRSHKDDHLPV